jgi:adenylate cyclase
MAEELRSRENIKDTFGKFVDPRIVNWLIASGADQAERRTLTVFVSDIKEFTGISEQLTASAVVNLLNSYFGAVAEVIRAHHGVIDKFIGDARRLPCRAAGGGSCPAGAASRNHGPEAQSAKPAGPAWA